MNHSESRAKIADGADRALEPVRAAPRRSRRRSRSPRSAGTPCVDAPPARRRRPGRPGCPSARRRRPARARAAGSRGSARRASTNPFVSASDEDRADQRRAERRAEVLRRALQAAGLVDLGRVDRRHDHVAELREQQARRRRRTPRARARTRSPTARRRSCRAAGRDAAASASRPTCATRLGASPAASFGPEHRRDEHRHRHREQPLARLERVEARARPGGRPAGRRTCRAGSAAASSASSARRAGCRILQQRAVEQRVAALRARAAPPTARTRRGSRAPARMKNGTLENPNGVISSPPIVERAARLDPAPLAALEDPEHGERRGRATESSDADDVELRPARGRAATAAAGGARAGSPRR